MGMTPRVVFLAPLVVSPYSDDELRARFEGAKALLGREQYASAAGQLDQLVRLAPDGVTAPASLYNAATAYEATGEPAVAADRYQDLVRRFPKDQSVRMAMVRLSRLYAYLERWSDLVAVGDSLLLRQDLTVIDTIQAHGARALGLAELRDLDAATRAIGRARDIVEQLRLGEYGIPPPELAQVRFALGELRRMASEEIVFVPLPRDFAAELERRCQGLLDAQDAYMDAMRSLDAHWSAMAGYRIGQLYQQLHRDVMAIPPPAAANTPRKRELFEGAMRLRYRVLLEKGLKMMAGTVQLGERTGEDSAWVHRAENAKRDIELAFEEQKAVLARLPFSESELAQALEVLRHSATR
jgi:tetratricopeptide (TPR) repeat protein